MTNFFLGKARKIRQRIKHFEDNVSPITVEVTALCMYKQFTHISLMKYKAKYNVDDFLH